MARTQGVESPGRAGAGVARSHLPQGLVDGADDEGADEARLAEAHFRLGGMDVDVDEGGIAGDGEAEHRMTVRTHRVGIGPAHGAQQQAVAHRAAVDREVDLVARAAMVARRPI